MVCHPAELPCNEDFLKFKILIGELVIFNDGGEFVAYDNRYPQSGAIIYSTNLGNQANTYKY